MNKELINNLPDLPELESVEASHRASLVAAAFITLMVGIVLLPSFGYWGALGQFLLPVALCTFLLVLPVVWVAYRACTSGYYWKTDAEGVTQRSLFRRRRIAWSEVTKVETRRTPFLSSTHCIYAESASIGIISHGGFSRLEVLEASIWQHLRRAGKESGMMLHGRPLSLWDTIPDAVLERVEVKAGIAQDLCARAIMYVLCVAMLFVGASDHREYWPWIGLASLIAGALIAYFTKRNAPAGHYVLTRECLEILGKTPRRIPWSSLTARSSESAWLSPAVERICTADECVHLLAPTGSDPDSLRARLALIRHLREAGRTMMIPDGLRLASPPVTDLPSGLDIRLPRIFVWFFPTLMTVFMALMAVMPRIRPWRTGDASVALTIAAFGWLVGLAAGRFRIHADNEGITKSGIFGRKSIRWSDVTSYKRSSPVPQSSRSLSLEISGPDGGAMIRIVADLLLAHDWGVLTAYIDSKLAHLLPPPEEQPSWLARPFSR